MNTDTRNSIYLRLNGFIEDASGYWYAPGDWADEAGPWPTAKQAIKWMSKHFN